MKLTDGSHSQFQLRSATLLCVRPGKGSNVSSVFFLSGRDRTFFFCL